MSTFTEQLEIKDNARRLRLVRILDALARKQPDGTRVARLDGNLFDPANIAEVAQLRPEWRDSLFVVRAPPRLVVGAMRHDPARGVFAVGSGDIAPAKNLETRMYVFLGLFDTYVPTDIKK
jgi:hypothetical protein